MITTTEIIGEKLTKLTIDFNDENIPIFDGVTGDRLKDSGVKLSDKADLTYVEYLMMEGDPA